MWGVPMKRRFGFMDLIVAVGFCTTIVASGLLLMVANGTQIRTVGWGAISMTTTFIVASLILLSLFTTGLFVFSPRGVRVPQTDLVHRGPAALVHPKSL